MASLRETGRFQPLRAGSVTQEREHVLNGKGSDSDGSRREDRMEPTPTREQTALGRRSPHKDLTHKDQDKDKDLTPKDKDLTSKDEDKDKELKNVLKESLRTRTRINIPGKNACE